MAKKTKVVRREALSYDVLLGAYKELKCDCTVHDLAAKLDRPVTCVGQRFNKMVKVFKEQGHNIPALKRKSGVAANVTELVSKYADIMSAIEVPEAKEPAEGESN